MDLNLDFEPKTFCDKVIGGFSREAFIIAMYSGEKAITYALSPQHQKRFLIWMTEQVAEYEKRYGEIDPGIVSPIESPFRSSDQRNPGDDKGKK